MEVTLLMGDCLEVLKTIPDNSIDSVVTDPPYGIGFMGKAWDTFIPSNISKAVDESEKSYIKHIDDKQQNPNLKGRKNAPIGSSSTFAGTYDLSMKGKNDYQQWCYEWGKECFRVLKPGGHLLASNSPRMYHRMAIGLEDAGFEIRDQILWIYGQGFPKSLNIGKTMDKFVKTGNASWNGTGDSSNGALGFTKLQHKQGYRPDDYSNRHQNRDEITEEVAQEWEGWGTALKPAHEPIVMARKPLSEKSIVENVLKHGTGGINIDGSRIGFVNEDTIDFDKGLKQNEVGTIYGGGKGFHSEGFENKLYKQEGRFPANIIFDEEAGKLLDEQSGISKSSDNTWIGGMEKNWKGHTNKRIHTYTDKGGASRFFYCPKTSKKDRNEGLEKPSSHPTVKPTDLMRYLINLVTPQNGTILDPFMGSGSTGKAAVRCGVNFIGIEKEQEYMDIARARIEHEKNKPVQTKLFNGKS